MRENKIIQKNNYSKEYLIFRIYAFKTLLTMKILNLKLFELFQNTCTYKDLERRSI